MPLLAVTSGCTQSQGTHSRCPALQELASPLRSLVSPLRSLVAQERLLLERERAEEEQRLLQQRINEAAEEERRRAEMCATLHTIPLIALLACRHRPAMLKLKLSVVATSAGIASG